MMKRSCKACRCALFTVKHCCQGRLCSSGPPSNRASCDALLETIFEKFLPYTVTHMCHDMTSLAIRAFRLGASTFCLPLAGIVWPSFGLNRVRSVPSTSDGGWTIPLQPKKNLKIHTFRNSWYIALQCIFIWSEIICGTISLLG